MALSLTDAAKNALLSGTKEPTLILKIDGLSTVLVSKLAHEYDSNGVLFEILDQDNLITLDGTSTSIKQNLDPFSGQGSSISTMSVALMDNGFATKIITPGEVFDDILNRKCRVYYGFTDTGFPDDYVCVFRGVVAEVVADPGKIVLNLNAPEDKKRTNIFKKIEAKLIYSIGSSDTAIALDSTENFLLPVKGPDGLVDPSFESCVRVNDEVIKYTGLSAARQFTASVTIASPSVFTATSHGMSDGWPLILTTNGALPTGFTNGNKYYVVNSTASTFQLSSTSGGAAISGTGTQFGTHTVTLMNMIIGCTRGYLATVPSAQKDDDTASTYYRLMGNGIDLALKIMASGNVLNGQSAPAYENIKVTSINVGGSEQHSNALYFAGVNVEDEYGIYVGDYVTVTGASNAGNNVTAKTVVEVIHGADGDFVVLNGVTLINEQSAQIKCSFTSQYATLPDGCRLLPDEIDVAEFRRIYQLFLNSVYYDFYIKEGIQNAREFLEKQVLVPMSAYSVPRKARISIGYHIGPMPGVDIKTFSASDFRNPGKMKIKRSLNKNFYNEVVYKFDEDPVDSKFNSGYITISQTSKNQIANSPNRTLTIEAKGLRALNNGSVTASIQSLRRLKRYQFGAEVFSFDSMFDKAFEVEIGDILIFDGSEVYLSDIKTGLKGLAPRLLECMNKDFQLKTGLISIEAVDTSFDGKAKYGLVSPVSKISSFVSSSEFVIESAFYSQYGAAEYKKWVKFSRPAVRIRSTNYSFSFDTVLVSSNSNQVTIDPPLPSGYAAGMFMELAKHSNANQTNQVKLTFGFMNNLNFSDGTSQYTML